MLVVRLWELDDADLNAMTSILRQNHHAAGMGRMLREDYDATFAFEDPLAGRFWRLQHKPGR